MNSIEKVLAFLLLALNISMAKSIAVKNHSILAFLQNLDSKEEDMFFQLHKKESLPFATSISTEIPKPLNESVISKRLYKIPPQQNASKTSNLLEDTWKPFDISNRSPNRVIPNFKRIAKREVSSNDNIRGNNSHKSSLISDESKISKKATKSGMNVLIVLFFVNGILFLLLIFEFVYLLWRRRKAKKIKLLVCEQWDEEHPRAKMVTNESGDHILNAVRKNSCVDMPSECGDNSIHKPNHATDNVIWNLIDVNQSQAAKEQSNLQNYNNSNNKGEFVHIKDILNKNLNDNNMAQQYFQRQNNIPLQASFDLVSGNTKLKTTLETEKHQETNAGYIRNGYNTNNAYLGNPNIKSKMKLDTSNCASNLIPKVVNKALSSPTIESLVNDVDPFEHLDNYHPKFENSLASQTKVLIAESKERSKFPSSPQQNQMDKNWITVKPGEIPEIGMYKENLKNIQPQIINKPEPPSFDYSNNQLMRNQIFGSMEQMPPRPKINETSNAKNSSQQMHNQIFGLQEEQPNSKMEAYLNSLDSQSLISSESGRKDNFLTFFTPGPNDKGILIDFRSQAIKQMSNLEKDIAAKGYFNEPKDRAYYFQ